MYAALLVFICDQANKEMVHKNSQILFQLCFVIASESVKISYKNTFSACKKLWPRKENHPVKKSYKSIKDLTRVSLQDLYILARKGPFVLHFARSWKNLGGN